MHIPNYGIEPFDLQTPLSSMTWTEKSTSLPLSSPLSFSTIPTERQLQLRGELTDRIVALERAMQVQVAESAVENARLRAEIEWLRDNQESDWALGLTDEMPPSYPDTISSSILAPQRFSG